jgi:ABC-2 type transport system permease protein
MRALLEVMQFEIRYQLRSPFFLGALLMFALIHFMSITQTFIHIDNFSNQVAINSVYAILQIEQALFIPGMLPIVAFVTTAMTRDFEHATAPLLYVTPISNTRPPRSYSSRRSRQNILCWEDF